MITILEISKNVLKPMEEVDEELWKLGVYAKTEHKEVAPCQFEIAPVYSPVNLANGQKPDYDGNFAKSCKSSWPGLSIT